MSASQDPLSPMLLSDPFFGASQLEGIMIVVGHTNVLFLLHFHKHHEEYHDVVCGKNSKVSNDPITHEDDNGLRYRNAYGIDVMG